MCKKKKLLVFKYPDCNQTLDELVEEFRNWFNDKDEVTEFVLRLKEIKDGNINFNTTS